MYFIWPFIIVERVYGRGNWTYKILEIYAKWWSVLRCVIYSPGEKSLIVHSFIFWGFSVVGNYVCWVLVLLSMKWFFSSLFSSCSLLSLSMMLPSRRESSHPFLNLWWLSWTKTSMAQIITWWRWEVSYIIAELCSISWPQIFWQEKCGGDVTNTIF